MDILAFHIVLNPFITTFTIDFSSSLFCPIIFIDFHCILLLFFFFRKKKKKKKKKKKQKGRKMGKMSKLLIDKELFYSAHNYHPLPVVLSRGDGVFVYDVEGKRYFDFLAAYSAVNQGHCHPKLLAALQEQASRLTLSSRAFHNDRFADFAAFSTKYFGYESVLPMNTGAEAVETAVKLARKWGYLKKKIPADEAIVVSMKGCFH